MSRRKKRRKVVVVDTTKFRALTPQEKMIAFLMTSTGWTSHPFIEPYVQPLSAVDGVLQTRLNGMIRHPDFAKRVELFALIPQVTVRRVIKTRRVAELRAWFSILMNTSATGKVMLSKPGLISELCEYYTTGTLPSIRRQEEQDFLSTNRPQSIVIQMCDVFVPVDVLRIVVSFYGYHSDTVNKVGLVGFDWWALVLSS